MRKFLLGALLPLLMLSSCSNNDESDPQEGEGTLVFKTKILTDVQVISTRAVKPDLFITMRNTSNNSVFIDKDALSEDGVMTKVPVGTYSIALSTHPDGFTPAFGAPCYEGSTQNVQVTKDSNQEVSMDCIQKNAGIRFIYDSSLQTAGLGTIYPVVKQNNSTLQYKGSEKQSTGYFNAGEVAITLTDDNGSSYTIGGAKEKKLTLGSEQLFEVTLKAGTTTIDPEEKGSITMTVNIIAVNTPTNREELLVDKTEGGLGYDCIFDNTPEGARMNIKTNTLMSEMGFYYIEVSQWDEQEVTKEQIMTSGRILSSSELAEVNTPNGKNFDLNNLKRDVLYTFWIYISANGKEKTEPMGLVIFDQK